MSNTDPQAIDPKDVESLKEWFEQNALDGDKLESCGEAMLSATFVFELLQDAKVAENEYWANVAIDSKPTQYDFKNRIAALQHPIDDKQDGLEVEG